MPKWRFWGKEPISEQSSALPGRTGTAGEPIAPTVPTREARPIGPDRLAVLKRRREGLLFDVEQSELAVQAENPWRERIALLNETIANIRMERARLDAIPRIDRPMPVNQSISIGSVIWEDPATVEFTIGDAQFRFESDIDWAERGTSIARSYLERRTGDVTRFAGPGWSAEDRAAFVDRLNESVFIFATDLRKRAENGGGFPESPSLSDLISSCPDCGDWQLWGGFCPTTAERGRQRKALDAEVGALLDEINREEEERAKLADRLPVALRRLADVENELKSLE